MDNETDNFTLLTELCKTLAPESAEGFIKDALLIKSLLGTRPAPELKASGESPPPPAEEERPHTNPYAPTKSANIINAAIPYFSSPDISKNVYSAMRIFEIMRIFSTPDIYAQSHKNTDPYSQSRNILEAVKPYLDPGEKRFARIIENLLEIKKLLSES